MNSVCCLSKSTNAVKKKGGGNALWKRKRRINCYPNPHFYSWQYIVNFSPHTSCIILRLDGPSQTKVHKMKNLIWEREREPVEKKKPDGSLFFFLFIVLISFGLWEKIVFMFGLCSAFFSHWDKEDRESEEERESKERGKNLFFIQPNDYFKWEKLFGVATIFSISRELL